jgi:late competence protein required for DNA uptake (superfamily II DNA/RNA helicase)
MAYQDENQGNATRPGMIDVSSMNIRCSNPQCENPEIKELPFMPRGANGIYCRACLPKFKTRN